MPQGLGGYGRHEIGVIVRGSLVSSIYIVHSPSPASFAFSVQFISSLPTLYILFRLSLPSRPNFFPSFPQAFSPAPNRSNGRPRPRKVGDAARCRPLDEPRQPRRQGSFRHHKPYRYSFMVLILLRLLRSHRYLPRHMLLPLHHLWQDASQIKQGWRSDRVQRRERKLPGLVGSLVFWRPLRSESAAETRDP